MMLLECFSLFSLFLFCLCVALYALTCLLPKPPPNAIGKREQEKEAPSPGAKRRKLSFEREKKKKSEAENIRTRIEKKLHASSVDLIALLLLPTREAWRSLSFLLSAHESRQCRRFVLVDRKKMR